MAATAAAGFAVLAAHRAYQRRPLRAALGVAVAALLVLYAAEVVTGVPDPRGEIERSGDALGRWAYLVVAGMAFFETGAPPFTVVFPGEWGVTFGGLLAREGEIELVPLVLVVWATSLLGDSWSFYLGRRFGRGYLVRQGTRFGVTDERHTCETPLLRAGLPRALGLWGSVLAKRPGWVIECVAPGGCVPTPSLDADGRSAPGSRVAKGVCRLHEALQAGDPPQGESLVCAGVVRDRWSGSLRGDDHARPLV